MLCIAFIVYFIYCILHLLYIAYCTRNPYLYYFVYIAKRCIYCTICNLCRTIYKQRSVVPLLPHECSTLSRDSRTGVYIINLIGLFVKFGNRGPEFLSPSEGTWSGWPVAISNRKSNTRRSLFRLVPFATFARRSVTTAFGVGCWEVPRRRPPFDQLSEATKTDVATRRDRKGGRNETRSTRISLKLHRGLIRPIPLLTKTSTARTLIDSFNPVSLADRNSRNFPSLFLFRLPDDGKNYREVTSLRK